MLSNFMRQFGPQDKQAFGQAFLRVSLGEINI